MTDPCHNTQPDGTTQTPRAAAVRHAHTRAQPAAPDGHPLHDASADDLMKASAGDRDALGRVAPLISGRISTIARDILKRDRAADWVNASSLIGMAYIKLLGQRNVNFADEARVMAVLTTIMRRIVVDIVRQQTAEKRGGGLANVSLHSGELVGDLRRVGALEIEDAISSLARFSPDRARIAEMHLWGGMNFRQIAVVMDLSEDTVRARWTSAKAWLTTALADQPAGGAP